jgi:CRP/FNR family cyclic AMP-dependent transcriptional regulator
VTGVQTCALPIYFMNKFRKLGLISYNGHIEVNNSLLSAVLHEKPVLKERE